MCLPICTYLCLYFEASNMSSFSFLLFVVIIVSLCSFRCRRFWFYQCKRHTFLYPPFKYLWLWSKDMCNFFFVRCRTFKILSSTFILHSRSGYQKSPRKFWRCSEKCPNEKK